MMTGTTERGDADPQVRPEPPRFDVLGVEVSSTNMSDACERIAGWIDSGSRRYVCVTPVAGVMESQRDPRLREIHNASGLTVPDGTPVVWAGRYAGAPGIERVYGPDLMLAICGLAASRGWKCFFYGGGPGTAERLADRLRTRFPGLEVAGTYCPPFRELTPEEDARVIEMISASGADLVWVGISTPKQERWMSAHVDRLEKPCVLLGVGAAFDIHAGLKRDAPRWLGRLGLHWLFRLLQEPRRLWRRYVFDNPAFVTAILRRPPRMIEDRDRLYDTGSSRT